MFAPVVGGKQRTYMKTSSRTRRRRIYGGCGMPTFSPALFKDGDNMSTAGSTHLALSPLLRGTTQIGGDGYGFNPNAGGLSTATVAGSYAPFARYEGVGGKRNRKSKRSSKSSKSKRSSKSKSVRRGGKRSSSKSKRSSSKSKSSSASWNQRGCEKYGGSLLLV